MSVLSLISESTSLVYLVGGAFAGGVAWLTKLHWDVSKLKNDVEDATTTLSDYAKQDKGDSERLVRVEEQIKNLTNSNIRIENAVDTLARKLP